jgi:hypothetical protein
LGAEAKNFSRFPEELGTMAIISPKWLSWSFYDATEAPTLFMNSLQALVVEGISSPFVSQIWFVCTRYIYNDLRR